MLKHKNASQASGGSNFKYLATVNLCVPSLLPFLKSFSYFFSMLYSFSVFQKKELTQTFMGSFVLS